VTRPDVVRRSIAEFLGTFALVAIGPGAVMVSAATHSFGNLGIALAFGLVITLCVASMGPISGAHINPAVTLGFWSIGRLPWRDAVAYVVAQCAGAVCAALLLRWLLGPVANLGATPPMLTLPRAFAIEAGYSALLAFVIMAVAIDDRAGAVAPSGA
jgi:aquaporin NIP